MTQIKLSEHSRKHDAIILAASELFVSRGYDGVSMEVIAEAANVSRQTIYNQFESKEALFRAIIDELVDEFMEPLARASRDANVRETLIAFAEHTLGLLVRRKFVALYRLSLTETDRFPDFCPTVYKAGAQRAQETVAEYLREQAQNGHLELADPFVAAGHFMALTCRDTELKALFGVESRLSSQEIRRRAKAGVAAFLKAYGTNDLTMSLRETRTNRRPLRRA
ncbi:TetR/AcrR family transcriptional regulator [Hyphomicrobium sp. DY-1]|uniref:TetR/AcrR family transcriptional regulator n=1 Tax=Hyphomicrobium sp. DY-1 TaxID=3075650 RepID=UPI0039C053DD